MKKMKVGRITCIVALFYIATTVAGSAQTFTSLVSFDGTNGAMPWFVNLVQGTDGNLYGTTSEGGTNTGCGTSYGCGTIFRMTPAGELTTLYSFCALKNCTDGWEPTGSVVQAANGNFYGTTQQGGNNNNGTIFEITPGGKLTTLYTFCSQANCADGSGPSTSLTLGADGNLYGTTFRAGFSQSISGTLFKITPNGTLTTLHNFCSQPGCSDGAGPSIAPTQASNGYLYGSTNFGGLNECNNGSTGCGTLYEITPAGKLTTLLRFGPSGGPNALIQAADGNLYGTSEFGGTCPINPLGGCGTVFKMTLKGKVTSLYSFCDSGGYCPDGELPTAGLVQGNDGNFYGTTSYGGNNLGLGVDGTAFQITPAGNLSTLHSFCSQYVCTEGNGPYGGLVQATNGNFYGVTFYGGDSSACGGSACGTVFSLSVGLGPFVEASPNFGKVGKVINILGNNLTGTTSVTVNGVSASFAVVSSTLIKTKVPTGATTGTIQVTTPSGKLTSKLAFQVIP